MPQVSCSSSWAPYGPVWVQIDDVLTVSNRGVEVTTITHPGTVIGEVSVLLGLHYGATVAASTAARLRLVEDSAAFLGREPDVLRLVAEGLDRRLNFVTTHSADLKGQYGGGPGLAMVAEVLSSLGHHGQPTVGPGSARDPEPTY